MSIRMKVGLKIDESGMKSVREMLSPRNSKTINTGWWDTVHEDGNMVAQIAAWNEEGHINGGMFSGTVTPPRPFIRTGFNPSVIKKLNSLQEPLSQVFRRKVKWEDFFSGLSEELREDLRDIILEWSTPPNSASTIELKGFNDPLIDTATMYSSVKTEVTKFKRRE